MSTEALRIDAGFLPRSNHVTPMFGKIIRATTEVAACTTVRCVQSVEGGTFQWSVVITDMGPTAEIVVGFVPSMWSNAQAKLFADGGWGISQTGAVYGHLDGGISVGGRSAVMLTKLRFSAGDVVTVRLDTDAATVQFACGANATTALKLLSFPPAGVVVFPAVSIEGSAVVELGSLTDVTPLDTLQRVLSNRPQDPRLWERVYKRMMETDTIKAPIVATCGSGSASSSSNGTVLSKEDVYFRWVALADSAVFNCELPSVLERGKLPQLLSAAKASPSLIGVLATFFHDEMAQLRTRVNEQDAVIATLTRRIDALGTHSDHHERAASPQHPGLQPSHGSFRKSPSQATPGTMLGVVTGAVSAAAAAAALAANNAARRPSKPVQAKGVVVRPHSKITKAPVKKPPRLTVTTQQKAMTIRPDAGGANPLMNVTQRHTVLELEIQGLGEIGSPSDADLKNLEKKRKEYAEYKKEATAKILKALPFSAAHVEDAREELESLVETIVVEGDHNYATNGPLLAALVKVPLDWPTLIREKSLATIAACDGTLSFLESLLSVPKLSLDTVELVQSAFFNQACRIPCALTVLRHAADALDNFEGCEEEVAQVWQEFFEDVASEKRSIPREDRHGRMELLQIMISYPTFRIDPTVEGLDCQTVFSRAAREGDLAVAKLLMEKKLVKDVGRVQGDTTTALIQAVVGNHKDMVAWLLTQPGVNLTHAAQDGTALFLAKSLHRDPAIVALLEKASK